MLLELKDKEGVMGTIELTEENLKELRGHLGYESVSAKLGEIETKLAGLPVSAENAEVAEPTPEELAQLWLDQTKELLPKMEDDTFIQIATEHGKGHLLASESAVVSEEGKSPEVEVREGKVEEEGWFFLEASNKSYRFITPKE